MDDCPFCRIVAGEKDASVLLDTDRTIAFLDDNPAIVGHTLVVPTTHREFLFMEDESISRAVFETVRRCVGAINGALDPDGVSTFYTSGAIAGNMRHAHVHLIPRFRDDDIRIGLSRKTIDPGERDELASRLREEF